MRHTSAQDARRRLAAFAALSGLLAALFLPILGFEHIADADADELALGAAVHHSRTQFERVIASPGDHCLACHLQRVVSGAQPPTSGRPAPPPTAVPYTRPDALAVARADRTGLPPRAPPLTAPADVRLRPSLLS